MFSGEQILKFLLCFIFFCINKCAHCQSYVFAQLNGSPINTTGWNLQGDARVTNVTGTADSEILICSVSAPSGAVFYKEPINLSQCNKWIAEFDFRMFDGSGADGLAFCFLDVPPSGYIAGGNLGIPKTANGLKVCFDTWNNCIPFNPSTVHQLMPKIEIRWGIGYDNVSNPDTTINGECNQAEPTVDNSDGKLTYLRSADYNHAKISYDRGNIQVFVNDTLYLTGYQQFNFAGYLGFTASTGGYTDNHSIKNVIIYTDMPPSIAGHNQSFCPYDTIQIGGSSNPLYSYLWYPSTNLDDSTASAPYLYISGVASTRYITYHVRTSLKTNPICASTDSVIIKVFPDPIVNFITPEICLNDTVAHFYDSSYTKDNTSLPFIYEWNFGDPNAKGNNQDTSTAENPSHLYSTTGNYYVRLKVTNSDGCTDSLSKLFTVNGSRPISSFSVNHASGLCSNQTTIITNESSVDFGKITRVQISWGDSATISYFDDQPYPGKLYYHNYPKTDSSNPSSYKIQMISYSGIACENESGQIITVEPEPRVQFNSIPPLCDNDSAILITQASELTGLPGSFSFSGDGVSTDGLFNPQSAGAGSHILLYKFISTNGCVDSAFQTIMIFQSPSINSINDTFAFVNQPLQLNAVVNNTTEVSFLWSPFTGLNNPYIQDPVLTLTSNFNSITYSVKATDTSGCYGETSFEINVFKDNPNIYLPNAFTPGNTTNNVFRPISRGISSIEFFRIYNRWGQLVYSTSQIGIGWDGTISGKLQETGSYVWMIQAITNTGNVIFRKGTMTLIR